MLKRSSQLLDDLSIRRDQLKSDINYLQLFSDHFAACEGKVLNKNTLLLNAGLVRGRAAFSYSSMILNAYTLNSEGYTDYKIKMLRDQYLNVSRENATTIPEGKIKECFKAAEVLKAIDETITAKKEEIRTIEKINHSYIADVMSKYNTMITDLKKFYNDNTYLLHAAGVDYALRNPEKAVIDIEGYRPLKMNSLEEEASQYKKAINEGKFKEYIELKNDAIQVLRNNNGWLENNTLELISLYGCIVSGDREYCTIYPECEDDAGVIPSINVSINRGGLC